MIKGARGLGKSYHDAEAQAQRTRQEDIAVLDSEILLAGKQADDAVDTYYGSTENAG